MVTGRGVDVGDHWSWPCRPACCTPAHPCHFIHARNKRAVIISALFFSVCFATELHTRRCPPFYNLLCIVCMSFCPDYVIFAFLHAFLFSNCTLCGYFEHCFSSVCVSFCLFMLLFYLLAVRNGE